MRSGNGFKFADAGELTFVRGLEMESLAKDYLDRAAGAHHVARQPDFAIAAAADAPEHLVIRHCGQMLEGVRIGNVSHASIFCHYRHILRANSTPTKRILLETGGGPRLHQALRPLPARNEWGEDRGEGKPIKTHLLSPALSSIRRRRGA